MKGGPPTGVSGQSKGGEQGQLRHTPAPGLESAGKRAGLPLSNRRPLLKIKPRRVVIATTTTAAARGWQKLLQGRRASVGELGAPRALEHPGPPGVGQGPPNPARPTLPRPRRKTGRSSASEIWEWRPWDCLDQEVTSRDENHSCVDPSRALVPLSTALISASREGAAGGGGCRMLPARGGLPRGPGLWGHRRAPPAG